MKKLTTEELKNMTMAQIREWVDSIACAINRTSVMCWDHTSLFKGYNVKPEYLGYNGGRFIVEGFHFTSKARKADYIGFAEWLHWAIFGEYPTEETEDTTEAQTTETAAPAEEQTTEPETEEEETETPATPGEMIKVRNFIMSRGGYRERELLKAPHTITHGETWNDAHKVVNILATTPDPDGYRPGCAVDIVARAIVG